MEDATMRRIGSAVCFVLAGAMALAAPAAAEGGPQRVKISGEIIDTWCQLTGIMGPALGTAHHQCAIWCAVGGIPVGIQGDDGTVYVLLKIEGNGGLVGSTTLVNIQTDHVTADADLYARDGVNYLVVSKVLENDGVVDITHPQYGIIPFGE
jgi:hypothetical protein